MINMLVVQMIPPTAAELLEEAHAWGFDTTAEWMTAMDEAYLAAEKEEAFEPDWLLEQIDELEDSQL